MRLNANNLKLLKAYSFFGYGSIKYLYLQDNQIAALSRNSFDDLKATLRMVNLANNRIDYVHGDEFRGYSDLEVIVLSGNPIKNVETVSFIGTLSLPKLKLFYLTRTELSVDQMGKIVGFTKMNSNASVKFRERRLIAPTITKVDSGEN